MSHEQNVISIDLRNSDNFELGSCEDADLMRIVCYATTEGLNANKCLFRREILARSYLTFVDKPVIIAPDKKGLPTGHAFDFSTKEFDDSKRKFVGHITKTFPVIVDEDENIYDIGGMPLEEIPDGEYRVCAELVIYKQYIYEVAETLKLLHELGQLKFSMESKISYEMKGDVKDCTSILFTGLAIVSNPAFKNSKSILVAEEMEECNMEEQTVEQLKETCAQLQAQNDTLVAEKQTVETELASVKEELVSTKESLANVKVEVAELKTKVEDLKPYKEKVEVAEKEALGAERLDKLSKFSKSEHDVTELAEMSKEEFADLLVQAADNIDVSNRPDGAIGVPFADTSVKCKRDQLVDLLRKI